MTEENPPVPTRDIHHSARPLALVTGASSGIGLELAWECARNGFDLLIAADDPDLNAAAHELGRHGGSVEAILVDLSTVEGVDELLAAAGKRPVDALLANAGHGLGKAFLDQEFADLRHVIDTNVTGTLYLIHKIGRQMRDRGNGRILITGSIAGYLPGTYQAAYNGSKAFIDMFAYALRAELQQYGVTVTCLMPGPTETEFFERAELTDTKVGQSKKDDPADVARTGFKAMMDGEAGVVSGWQNKLQVALAKIMPETVIARQHTKIAAPGSGRDSHP